MKTSNSRNAFTLIELLVTVAIMAILAGIVTVRLNGYLRNAAQTRLMEQLQEADRQARLFTRQMDTAEATLRFNAQAVELRCAGYEAGAAQVRSFAVPKGLSLKLGTATDKTTERVRFFSKGYSPTYVIEVSDGKPLFWFVALGSSGQCLRLDEKSQVDALLARSYWRRGRG